MESPKTAGVSGCSCEDGAYHGHVMAGQLDIYVIFTWDPGGSAANDSTSMRMMAH